MLLGSRDIGFDDLTGTAGLNSQTALGAASKLARFHRVPSTIHVLEMRSLIRRVSGNRVARV